MTLAILVFNFYPVTAVMIVMLALLNDGGLDGRGGRGVSCFLASPRPAASRIPLPRPTLVAVSFARARHLR